MSRGKRAVAAIIGWPAVLVILVLAALGTLRLWAKWRYREQIFNRVEDVPPRPVAIVFGAGLWPDGSPTPVLADRVATARDLYAAGKVQKLLCSGDNRFIWYDEPLRMKEYAVRLGVPEGEIVLDYAGRRTYDTCYRARAIFGVEQAILVTQRFHAVRALFLCEHLGVEAVAVAADRRTYSPQRVIWELREYLALAQAWWDIYIAHPLPVLGEPLPIQFDASDVAQSGR